MILTKCLVCGNPDIHMCHNLGMMPLANNLKSSQSEPDPMFPLEVMICLKCTHKQLSIAVDPEVLFSSYLYQTGTSESHLSFFDSFVRNLKKKGKVLDIGCNDGSLLKAFKEHGWEIQGVEPAKNLIKNLNNWDIPVINDFFPTKQLEGRLFDCIVAFNVFAHNSDPRGFLAQMKAILQPQGRIFIITTKASMANFYHEHISYFTLESMAKLVGFCNLQIRDFKEVSMHNGGYLFEISHPERIEEISKIKVAKNAIGYGASAGGTVILNYFNLELEYIIDDNPLKQGKFIPGVNTPIYNSSHLYMDQRDLTIVVLAYNLFDEIVEKIKKLRPNRKDTFIHPLEGGI